jgi:hypothetical protein
MVATRESAALLDASSMAWRTTLKIIPIAPFVHRQLAKPDGFRRR